MSKTAVLFVALSVLAASVASASSLFQTGSAEDFCFGYAICE